MREETTTTLGAIPSGNT